MNESWQAEWEEEEFDVPTAGLGYRGELWIDESRILPDRCPDCLKHKDFDCSLCEFFAPETCKLLRDPIMMDDFRTVISIWRESRAAQLRQQAAYLRQQQELLDAIQSELQAHGRPLHHTVLTRMVADRNPELQVSERRVVMLMASHPWIFEKVAEGVYQCRREGNR